MNAIEIIVSQERQFISTNFTRPEKGDTEHRKILNLKHLNKHIKDIILKWILLSQPFRFNKNTAWWLFWIFVMLIIRHLWQKTNLRFSCCDIFFSYMFASQIISAVPLDY